MTGDKIFSYVRFGLQLTANWHIRAICRFLSLALTRIVAVRRG